MRPNLNEQCDSIILSFFGNDITQFNTLPVIISLTAFDLIYSKFSTTPYHLA